MKPAHTQRQPQRLSRRAFLRGLATTVTGALVVACGPPRSTNRAEIAFGPEATPQIILPSPVPPTTPAAVQETPLLTEFLALSALLTGVANLNQTLGQTYLQSLQTRDEADSTSDLTVAQLIKQAGLGGATPPTSIADLETTGLFTQESARKLADTITEMWYTGVYPNEQGEETVATYVDALAWQTLTFTKPMTICGYPGFWSEAWEPVLE